MIEWSAAILVVISAGAIHGAGWTHYTGPLANANANVVVGDTLVVAGDAPGVLSRKGFVSQLSLHNGTLRNVFEFNGHSSFDTVFHSAVTDGAENIFMAGTGCVIDCSAPHAMILKLDSLLEVKWALNFGSVDMPISNRALALSLTPNGQSLAVVGQTQGASQFEHLPTPGKANSTVGFMSVFDLRTGVAIRWTHFLRTFPCAFEPWRFDAFAP